MTKKETKLYKKAPLPLVTKVQYVEIDVSREIIQPWLPQLMPQ